MKDGVTMKVISGKYKGRVIEGFNIDGTRPTMDRVKESLFAMIQDYLQDSICLDLFSGSGNLAIEAISEGAKYVYLVDHNKKAIELINKNISKLNIMSQCKILNMNYQKGIENLKSIKFDIIFLDPPYNTNYIEESLILINKYNLLNDDGIIVCESDSLDKIIYDGYIEIKSRKYGDKYIVILRKI